ncbi:hypothetical protein AB0M80_42410 [Amycolatopsis sp. NPDC051045]|uniref:hypothetical protein n=1 Tax=Amycolatopsis sp. NPDC051045 TaxID=3156922 RepID=UPI00342873CD
MPSEFDTYRDTVLDAARRAGNIPPVDLFLRYDIDPNRVRDPEEFKRRVAAVVKFWRSLKHQRKYLPLATALLTADTDLSRRGRLTLEAFTEQHAESRSRARAKMDDRIAAVADSAPCLTVSGLRRLLAMLDGAFTESEVRAALAEKNITVIEPPWDLPAGPPAPSARSLAGPLRALGSRLSPDVVFGADAVRAGFRLKGGFRLAADGKPVTQAELFSLREKNSRSKHDEHKTAVETVLAILIGLAEQADALHKLFLWEVAEQLRPDVEAGLPVRVVTQSATDLGLDPAEAVELAVTLTAGTGRPVRDDTAARRIAEAIRCGELDEARSLLDEVPSAECAQERAELEAITRRVADLTRQADSALAGGDSEEAAALLAEASSAAADDESLRARLAAIPPPSPSEVTAGIDGVRGRIHVRWAPSRARTPAVRYRVVRAAGSPAVTSSAGTTIAETTGNEAEDELPPPAVPVCYTVFASRGGEAWSAGVATPPVESVPGVADLELRATEQAVAGSWRTASGTSGVLVTRSAVDAVEGDSSEPVPVPAQETSAFTDPSVRTGVTYEYAVTALYRSPSGEERRSVPVCGLATPTAPPTAVEELRWRATQDGGASVVELNWSKPRSGTAEIRVSAGKPEWPVGTVVPRATATGIGKVVGGTVTTDDRGYDHLVFRPPQGRVVLTAITVSGDRAAIGAGTTVSLLDPVSDLRTWRHGEVIRLFWTWPPGASRARVAWWPTATGSPSAPLGEFGASLREHTASGGVTFTARPGPITVSVRTVTGRPGADESSPAVTAMIAGERAKVTYAVEATGLPGRRRHEIVLTSDQPCHLPAVLVVHRKDGILPLRVGSGTTLATITARELAAGQRVSVPLEVLVRPLSGLACFLDPSSAAPDEVILVPATPQ